jgi:hypothetical protein
MNKKTSVKRMTEVFFVDYSLSLSAARIDGDIIDIPSDIRRDRLNSRDGLIHQTRGCHQTGNLDLFGLLLESHTRDSLALPSRSNSL